MRLRDRVTRLAVTPNLPRRTVRLRLTLLYGGLFFASGAALLATIYVLVVHATKGFVFQSQSDSVSIVQERSTAGAKPGQQAFGTHAVGGAQGPRLAPRQAEAQARALQAQADSQHERELHQLLTQSGIALAGMGLLSIALGWLMAGRVLRPLRTITAAARAISAANLHERLALTGPDDELKELGDTVDQLLARLEASFESQRRFVANASHELRTPLARQRALAQVALADPDASVQSLRAAHLRVLAAEEQLERLIEALLTLSRGEAGLDRQEPFDLADVADQVLLAWREEAARRGVDLHQRLTPATAAGDPRLVERLVANLIDNGLRYNLAGGRLDVTTDREDGRAVLSVRNTGPLVPSTNVDELLQPFQRLDADRTSQGEGTGLGLSIVRAIADAHYATLTVDPQTEGGLDIKVSFPPQP